MGTGVQNSRRKEAVLRYRLQKDVITQTGAPEVEGLRNIAATVSVLLSQKEGDIEGVVTTIVGTLRASHMDGDGISVYFGRCRGVRKDRSGRDAGGDIGGRQFGEGAGVRES